MKKRIFICGFYQFPRGSAASNYVHYLSKALLESGYAVVLITDVNTSEKNYLHTLELEHLDLKIIPVELNSNKILHYLEYNYLLGKMIVHKLKKEKISKNDLVICYSGNYQINKSIINFVKKRKIKSAACVVEWYSSEYFGNNKKGLKEYNKTFYDFFLKYDLLFPISTYIEEHFIGQGIKCFRLPILCDTKEYELGTKINNKRLIVYPANGRMKDALQEMLKAFSMLSESVLDRMEIHITGVSMEQVRKYLTKNELDKLKKSLKLHSWMNYSELVNLYNSSHYLILAREINQMTKANFPSKVPEVMSHGVVPIVSRVGDYTKLLLENKYNAFVFDGCQAETIASTIEEAVNLPEEEYIRMMNNALESVWEKLDYRHWVERLKCVIEKI